MNLENLILKLEQYKKELEKINHIYNRQKFIDIFSKFRLFLTSIDNEEIEKNFCHSSFYFENRDYFRQSNIYYERAIETEEAINILQNFKDWKNIKQIIKSKLITDNFFNKQNDIKNLNLSSDKNLLMVNCGPLAETLLYINYNTSITNIVWIDYTYESIYIVWELCRKLWLENIKFEYSRWENYDYKDADIIYIPSFIEEKDEILNQIINTSKKDVQIIVRNPIWISKLIYKPISHIPDKLNIINQNNSIRNDYSTAKMLILQKYNI